MRARKNERQGEKNDASRALQRDTTGTRLFGDDQETEAGIGYRK